MEKISKNLYKGELITNPIDLKRLANERRSIYFKYSHISNKGELIPAAFLINMPFSYVISRIESKHLYFTHK